MLLIGLKFRDLRNYFMTVHSPSYVNRKHVHTQHSHVVLQNTQNTPATSSWSTIKLGHWCFKGFELSRNLLWTNSWECFSDIRLRGGGLRGTGMQHHCSIQNTKAESPHMPKACCPVLREGRDLKSEGAWQRARL